MIELVQIWYAANPMKRLENRGEYKVERGGGVGPGVPRGR